MILIFLFIAAITVIITFTIIHILIIDFVIILRSYKNYLSKEKETKIPSLKIWR